MSEDIPLPKISRAEVMRLITDTVGKVDLAYYDMKDVFLADFNFRGAILKGCNLSNANLHDSNLSCCDLSAANLENANLQRASLEQANLTSAVLRGADFSDANLNDAIMEKVDLYETNLRNARMTGTRVTPECAPPARMAEVYSQTSSSIRKDGLSDVILASGSLALSIVQALLMYGFKLSILSLFGIIELLFTSSMIYFINRGISKLVEASKLRSLAKQTLENMR